MRPHTICALAALVLSAALVPSVIAQAPPPTLDNGTPNAVSAYLRGVGIDQKLDSQLPLDITMTDETGKVVKLSDYVNGSKPVMIIPVYYRCPGLCDMELNQVVRNLRMLKFTPGKEFEVVTFSFDPKEGYELAAAKKAGYVGQYNKPGGNAGWHFLTGDAENIARLTQAIGFRYFYDDKIGQFAHASCVIITTPSGKLSRYFYNVEYSVRDLQLGLVEASDNKIGSMIDKALIYCYHYDPAQGKYGVAVFAILRVAAVLTVAMMAGGLWFLSHMSRRRMLAAGQTQSPADKPLEAKSGQ